MKLFSRHVFERSFANVSKQSGRYMAHYPIDESIFGLTEEQQSVRIESNKCLSFCFAKKKMCE